MVDRGKFLSNCDFFIGVSSGLSWLAWMMHKPVILISGFTNAITEFYTPYRVINKYVCNSCWNDHTIKWDPNTTVCPRVKNNISDKNFLICSRSIGYNSVILNIKKLLETKNYGKENSDTY